MTRLALALSLLFAACAAGPQIHPDVEEQAYALVAAMREHAPDDHPPPPELYAMPMGWPVMLFGKVIAIDGDMLAVRFDKPEELPEHPEEMIVPISGEDHQIGIRGDGVVAARMGDILICRFFAKRHGNATRPKLGDDAYLDRFTRPARR